MTDGARDLRMPMLGTVAWLSALAATTTPPWALALAGAAGPLLGRVAERKLEAHDLASVPAWPCEEVGAPPRLWKAYVEAAGASVTLWRDPPEIPEAVIAQIAATGLAPAARGTLLAQAEQVSGHGVRQGDEASLTRGEKLCTLARKLSIETAGNCKGLDVVRAKLASRAR